MKSFLLAIYVLTAASKGSYAPVKGALIACDEITVATEEGEREEGGWWVPTDSRGRMVFEGYATTYHCRVYAEGYNLWQGPLEFNTTHRDRSVVMERVQ